MPLKTNLLERFAINAGMVPGIMIDMGIPLFQLYAMIGAMETGFFRHLAEGPATASALAEKMNASQQGVKHLIQVLEPMGYLKENNGKYALSKIGRNMPIDILEAMAPYWKHQAAVTIPEAGRGILEAPENGVYGWEHVKSGDVGRGYQVSMRWMASSMVDGIVKKIKLPEDANVMLDVGGSHGLYTVKFCQKYPNLKGRVLDWKIGLEEAEKTLKEYPDVADRIELVERDFEKEDLPAGNDFTFLGNIIHGISPKGNQALLKKISHASNPDGMIAIQDQFAGIKGSKFGRAIAGMAGLNLFLFSGGRAYEYEQVKKWLHEAEFTKTKLHNLQQPGMSLVVSQKT